MPLSYIEVNERVREIRAKYYDALKRQDLDGFFRDMAIKQLEVEAQVKEEQQ